VRKFLIFRRSPDDPAHSKTALRDALLAGALVGVGAVLIGGTLALAARLLPSLAFLPLGSVLILAACEKVAQGLGYGVSLGAFVRRDFRVLLQAREIFFGVSLIAVPACAYVWGADGFLLATSLASVVFFAATLGLQRRRPIR